MRSLTLAVLIAIATSLSSQQQPPAPARPPLITTYLSLDFGATHGPYAWVAVDPPLTVTIDGNKLAHIGVDLNAVGVQLAVPSTSGDGSSSIVGASHNLLMSPSRGLVFATSKQLTPDQLTLQLGLDSSIVASRIDTAPAAPGSAGGTADFAVDENFIYFQAPAASGWVWARVPLQTTW